MPSALQALQDDELLKACARGDDPEAWREFVNRTQPLIAQVLATAVRRYGDTSLAVVEDLVQDTYTYLVERRLLSAFKPDYPGAIASYLRIVALNVAARHFRKTRTQTRGWGWVRRSVDQNPDLPYDELMEIPAPAPAVSLHDAILIGQVEDGIADHYQGSDFERNLVIWQLHYRMGLTTAAISRIPWLRLSNKGVQSLLLRMIREARTRIHDNNSWANHQLRQPRRPRQDIPGAASGFKKEARQ